MGTEVSAFRTRYDQGIGVRLVKVDTKSIRVHLSRYWIERFEERFRERLLLGFCTEFPDYFLIATAAESNDKGYKVIQNLNGSVTVTIRTDPSLVAQILPGPRKTTVAPTEICQLVTSTGQKVIGIKCPGMDEYLRPLNCPINAVGGDSSKGLEQTEEESQGMETASAGDHHLVCDSGKPSSKAELCVSDAVAADEQTAEECSDRTIEDSGADDVALPEYELTPSIQGDEIS